MSAPIIEIEIDVDPSTVAVEIDPPTAAINTTSDPVVIFAATSGSPGPPGAPGTGGFTHTQSSPAATWTITNTLGRYPAAVTVVIGDEVVDADIETPDISTIVITFASAQSGRAEII